MKTISALLAALATALFVSACTTPASDGHTDHDHGASAESSQPAGVNDADRTFATMMIPHHQQAVELAALASGRSTNPELLKLATAVSAAQQPEIETLKVFLVQWNSGDVDGEAHAGHDMSDMQGMVDTATMEKLQTLTGPEFDTLWLQSMIGHHEGAIQMANTEIADGTNADAKKLAGEIAAAQTAEITQMKQMLGTP